MRKSRFSEKQIIAILGEQEAGLAMARRFRLTNRCDLLGGRDKRDFKHEIDQFVGWIGRHACADRRFS